MHLDNAFTKHRAKAVLRVSLTLFRTELLCGDYVDTQPKLSAFTACTWQETGVACCARTASYLMVIVWSNNSTQHITDHGDLDAVFDPS